jgi:hypothetical protein
VRRALLTCLPRRPGCPHGRASPRPLPKPHRRLRQSDPEKVAK